MSYRHLLTAMLLGLFTQLARTEIQEIPAEEMTEAYIRDTTVILQKMEESETESPETERVIRVSPLDDDFSEGKYLQEQSRLSPELATPDNQHLKEQNQIQLQRQSRFTFIPPRVDPHRASREEAVRSALGLTANQPVDLSRLSFPGSPGDVTPPAGTNLTTSPRQFVISIPNINGHPARTFTAPGGEYQIDISPDKIDFKVNNISKQ